MNEANDQKPKSGSSDAREYDSTSRYLEKLDSLRLADWRDLVSALAASDADSATVAMFMNVASLSYLESNDEGYFSDALLDAKLLLGPTEWQAAWLGACKAGDKAKANEIAVLHALAYDCDEQ